MQFLLLFKWPLLEPKNVHSALTGKNLICCLFLSKNYVLTVNGLSGQQMKIALNHVDMEFKNTKEQS